MDGVVERHGLEEQLKKIEIIVELQKAAAGIREDCRRKVWPI